MTVLHITNGDSAANIIAQSTVAGALLPWRDPMHHGPFPKANSLNAVSTLRADYLAGADLDPDDVRRSFRQRDDHLRRAARYDKLVLWFEHDLLDQLQILQILDLLAGLPLGDTPVQMICIDQFEGIVPFRGLGQLNTDQMAQLYDQRRVVTPEAFALAQSGWAAFCSNDPRDLLRVTQANLSALPFLKPALQRHFEEFPDARTGLSRSEAPMLTLVDRGVQDPVQIFLKNMDLETALYIGDQRSFRILADLCTYGLLRCDPAPFHVSPLVMPEGHLFRDQRLALTDVGRSILEGRAQAFDYISRDAWLGGVHFRSQTPLWVWNGQTQDLILRNPD